MASDHLPTGDSLRVLRETTGLTQAQLATRMRTTQQYISTIEGKSSVRVLTAERYRKAVYAYTTHAEASA